MRSRGAPRRARPAAFARAERRRTRACSSRRAPARRRRAATRSARSARIVRSPPPAARRSSAARRRRTPRRPSALRSDNDAGVLGEQHLSKRRELGRDRARRRGDAAGRALAGDVHNALALERGNVHGLAEMRRECPCRRRNRLAIPIGLQHRPRQPHQPPAEPVRPHGKRSVSPARASSPSSACALDFAIPSCTATSLGPQYGRSMENRSSTSAARRTLRGMTRSAYPLAERNRTDAGQLRDRHARAVELARDSPQLERRPVLSIRFLPLSAVDATGDLCQTAPRQNRDT